MSFAASAEDVRLEDGHILCANLQNEDGDMVEASIDLDTCIGNSDGSFEWEGVSFSESAGEVSLEIEGDDQIPVLRAELNNMDGEAVPCDLNLAERISNQNGEFVFE